MKPHKHAEIIKAWADGAKVQIAKNDIWEDILFPCFSDRHEYRIKPEPKPDYVRFFSLDSSSSISGFLRNEAEMKDTAWNFNIKITFDGDTNIPKSAELI